MEPNHAWKLSTTHVFLLNTAANRLTDRILESFNAQRLSPMAKIQAQIANEGDGLFKSDFSIISVEQ